MANGTTRTVLAKMKLDNKPATAELNEEMKLEKGGLPKFPLKASKSEHNHSK
jgi:hypothetical protein